MKGAFGVDFTPPWGSIKKANKKGIPLLTTGFCKAMQEQNLDEAALREKVDRVTQKITEWINAGEDPGFNITTMRREVDFIKNCATQAVELQADSSGFYAQCAQMDIFSSFYWMYRAGVSSKTLPALTFPACHFQD